MDEGTSTVSVDALISQSALRATQVYLIAAGCLVIGLFFGYTSRGVLWSSPAAPASIHAATVSAQGASAHAPITLAEMKQMADAHAAPLIEKLKTEPNNGALLAQVAALYHSAHQFDRAAAYYQRAVQIDPNNVTLRTKLASSLYRNGDVDAAITQLNQALTQTPKDANSLFNLGIIRLQGKHDPRGAIAAWQTLLRTNPELSAAQKGQVQNLLAQAVTLVGDQQGTAKEHAHAHP